MNRIRVPLVLLAAGLLLCACAQPMQPNPSPPGIAPDRMCADAHGVQRADAPIVCVDDSSDMLKVSPEPFVLHEKLSTGGNARPAVQWFTTSGSGDLKVAFKDERCVRNMVCHGSHCTAVAAKLTAGKKEERCKYDVMLTGHPLLDPEGVLTGCCVADEPTP